MRNSTVTFLLLAIASASIPQQVFAWSCDSECGQYQQDCRDWKKEYCTRDSLKSIPEGSAETAAPTYGPYTLESIINHALMHFDSSRSLRDNRQLEVRASRLFSGPGQYPPVKFAAYGIVAFRSLPVDAHEIARYVNICKGYVGAVSLSRDLRNRGVPLHEQMVTIWPVDNNELSDKLNNASTHDLSICINAVLSIDISESRNAILNAQESKPKASFNGRGPYVIAWSPSRSFGKSKAAVLVLNLSNVSTAAQAAEMFSSWAYDIEQNPKLWKGGWSTESLRVILRLWSDRWGSQVLSLFLPQH